MKRFLLLLTCIALLLGLSACGAPAGPKEYVLLPAETVPEDKTDYVVSDPLAYPSYTFMHNPSTREIREMAIVSLRNNLSIRWSTADGVSYNKTGPVSNKLFMHMPDTLYAGLPYSNASSGIFQFFEFYDEETGRLWFPYSDKEFNELLGNSCADSVIWGLCAVCDSLSGPFYPVTMVPKNGYIPIGPYTFDQSISSYNQLQTYVIVEQNGNDVMLESYAVVQPADLLVSSQPDNHAIMAIKAATVVRNEDGSINTEASFVEIQDQRGGQGAGFYEKEEDGYTVRYSGRTWAKYTFKTLLEKGYIPLSTAEFLGIKDYSRATVSIDKECTDIATLLESTVSCNYPLAVVKAVLRDKGGNELLIDRKLFSAASDKGVARSFALKELAALENQEFLEGLYGEYTLYVEVVASNGERKIPVEFSVTVE